MQNEAALFAPSLSRDLNACTYTKTGRTYCHQYWKRCLDCSTRSDVGACLNCIAVCHAGHRIDPELHRGKFFCDCGATGCKLSNRIGSVAPIRALDPPPVGLFPPAARYGFGAVPDLGLEDGSVFRCYATNEVKNGVA